MLRIYNLRRARVSIEAQLPSMSIHHQIVLIHRSHSPPTLPALWTDVPGAAAPDQATHDEWLNFTKGQRSSRIPYPTLALDTDAWCQFPCVGTGRWLQTPLTRLRLPCGAAIPATTHHEPWTLSSQIPTFKLSSPRGAAHFLPFTFTRHSTSANQPQDAHQSQSPVEGSP